MEPKPRNYIERYIDTHPDKTANALGLLGIAIGAITLANYIADAAEGLSAHPLSIAIALGMIGHGLYGLKLAGSIKESTTPISKD